MTASIVQSRRPKRRISRKEKRQIAMAIVAVVGLAVGLVAFVATRHSGGVAGVATSAPSSTSTTSARQLEEDAAKSWNSALLNNFGGSSLSPMFADFEQRSRDWAAGKIGEATFLAADRAHLAEMLAIQADVRNVGPFAYDGLAKPLFDLSAQLYVDWMSTTLELPAVPPGPVRDQLQLLCTRVQELANRVYDRGSALVDAALPPTPTEPDVAYEKPEEVPNWVKEGLAPGPPLDAQPPPPDPYPPLSSVTRPMEPRSVWAQAVHQLDIASPSALYSAIKAADLATNKAFAEGLMSAAETLRTTPDPATGAAGRPATDGREDSARIRLGLEVDADAARLGQLGGILRQTGGSALTAEGDRLVAAGEHLLVLGCDASLWSSDLGPRAFPALAT